MQYAPKTWIVENAILGNVSCSSASHKSYLNSVSKLEVLEHYYQKDHRDILEGSIWLV